MSEEGTKRQNDFNKSPSEEHPQQLFIHNDDYHTFDYVINAIIEVCNHDVIQAEQITRLVHYKGKNDVKKGSYEELEPLKQGFIDRGLHATIE